LLNAEARRKRGAWAEDKSVGGWEGEFLGAAREVAGNPSQRSEERLTIGRGLNDLPHKGRPVVGRCRARVRRLGWQETDDKQRSSVPLGSTKNRRDTDESPERTPKRG
jgi:hypothetical protein